MGETIAKFLGTLFSVFFLSALVVWLLWNYFAAAFHVPHIGYWEAMGLRILCRTLFKGDK